MTNPIANGKITTINCDNFHFSFTLEANGIYCRDLPPTAAVR